MTILMNKSGLKIKLVQWDKDKTNLQAIRRAVFIERGNLFMDANIAHRETFKKL